MSTDTNFVATGGPKIRVGFSTHSISGLYRGVVGIGNDGFGDKIKDTIGVLGFTSTTFLGGSTGSLRDGRGVVGLASGSLGIGVQGQCDKGGIGVQGTSIGKGGTGVLGTSTEGGTGVEGSSDTGTGVAGNGVVGVRGFGLGGIGVYGVSDSIGVLGGDRQGLDANMFVGVVGQGPTDPSGASFSYGGWFGRGRGIQGGTAPLHLEPATVDDPNPSLAAQRGDLFVDNAGRLWFCTNTGDNNPSPATWKQIQLV